MPGRRALDAQPTGDRHKPQDMHVAGDRTRAYNVNGRRAQRVPGWRARDAQPTGDRHKLQDMHVVGDQTRAYDVNGRRSQRVPGPHARDAWMASTWPGTTPEPTTCPGDEPGEETRKPLEPSPSGRIRGPPTAIEREVARGDPEASRTTAEWEDTGAAGTTIERDVADSPRTYETGAQT